MGQAGALGCSSFIFKMQLTQLSSFSWKFYNSNKTLWSPMVNFLWRLFFFWLSDAVPVFLKPSSEEDILCDNGLPKWQLDGSWSRSAREPGHISRVRRMCWLPFQATGPAANCRGAMTVMVWPVVLPSFLSALPSSPLDLMKCQCVEFPQVPLQADR